MREQMAQPERAGTGELALQQNIVRQQQRCAVIA